MKKIVLRPLIMAGLMLAVIHFPARAQNADQRTALSVYASGFQYHGTIGSEFWDLGNTKIGAGISVHRYLTRGLDAGLHLNFGKLDFSGNWGNLGPNNPVSFNANVFTGMLGLKAKMNNGWILKEDARIAPYLVAGAEYISAGTDGMRPAEGGTTRASFDENFRSFGIYGGAGIRVRLTDNLGLFIQTGQHYPLKDGLDGIVDPNAPLNDRFLQHQLGLTLNLGKAKDTDGDGVPDRRDDCPDTPAGVQVDKNGCPVDTDGDGVADYLDRCPNEAGVQALQGCPDRDNDGVADAEDECPDQAGPAATRGCPDADGDGVADKNDQCPDTPAGIPVDARGCPIDTDGDGVPDHLDRCPTSPGTSETNGCPELDDRTRQLIEEKVFFEFNKATIPQAYLQLLDSIIVALQKYPDHELIVKGNADHIGSEEYNQALSERRAQAVKEYLLERGVQNPNRIKTIGYGESQPLVPVNERLPMRRTVKERAMNRRVGFELNTPELQLNTQ
jgi:OOP family OmpA-OmpF porin